MADFAAIVFFVNIIQTLIRHINFSNVLYATRQRQLRGRRRRLHARLNRQRRALERRNGHIFAMYMELEGRQFAGNLIRGRDMWVRARPQVWWQDFSAKLDDSQWRLHFIMSRASFDFLVEAVRPYMERNDSNYKMAVDIRKRVAIAIWRLSTGCAYRVIQELFGVGRSTACTITLEFTVAVCNSLKGRFLRRPTPAEFLEIVQGFKDTWGFPQCAGAIDGTHIKIIAPSEDRNDYYNRKCDYSVICQAVCDYRYRFWDIEVGWPGKVHDARVFANSDLYECGQSGILFPDQREMIAGTPVPICLIGDPAYPLLPWLMKAYQEIPATPPEQRYFNYRLSRARMTIEGSFGRLKGRWRCLTKRLDHDIAVVPTIVTACCILHNICELRGDLYDGAPLEPNHHRPPLFQGDQQRGDAVARIARTSRNAICNHINANRLF